MSAFFCYVTCVILYVYYISHSFLKVGNSPKTSPTETDGNNTIQANSSWRQTILNRVVTPNKDHNVTEIEKINILKNSETPIKHRSRQELRDLWKKAINQQLILIRMEKENAKLRGKNSLVWKYVNPLI